MTRGSKSWCLLAVWLAAAPAVAQGLLPPLSGTPVDLGRTVAQPLDTVDRGLAGLRRLQIDALTRSHPKQVDLDPAGAPVVRGEVLAIEPDEAALRRAREAGFDIVRERRLEELDLRLVVLRAREGVGTRRALKQLRRLDPQGRYEFNHLYTGSGEVAAAVAAGASPQAPRAAGVRVGLVDGGVDAGHPALAGVRLERWGCGDKAVPSVHGTAVASLLAGSAAGGKGNVLYSADIYCGQPHGGAVDGLADALAWLARQRVAVVNLSLVGPPNLLLEKAVDAMLRRGHVIVAAVGNDGPSARPLYPAAYAGVIGVTAVDARRRVLPEALRGEQVSFAARGADLDAAGAQDAWARVRGTSYAAPLVARVAAGMADQPRPGLNAQVSARLAGQAIDLGKPGRDDVYGHGLVAASPDADDAVARQR